MTIVHGQIEPLKRIKHTLNQKGITRFNSIGDINDFTKNHELEKQTVINQIEYELDFEIDNLQADRKILQKNYEDLKTENIDILNSEISSLKSNYELIQQRNSNNLISKTYKLLRLKILKSKITNLEKNFDKILHQQTYIAENRLNETITKINEYNSNWEQIISERSLPKIKDLAYIKEVVDSLNPLIAGAIGENLVVKELQKLSDQYILFNDFSIDFKTPIYNRKENDRIYSVQIDHLLVTNSGIFIIETKNWSKASIESFVLRSPVKQIKRTSYALFTILSRVFIRDGIDLNKHHWGKRKIPIIIVVVMINGKPKEKFNYVQVKTLNELNRYITYFDPVFDDTEVKSISEYLKKIKT